MNRLPAAKDRKRQEKSQRGGGEGAQEGRVEEVNEYTRPLFLLLLKWDGKRGVEKPAYIGKRKKEQEAGKTVEG